MTDVTNTHASTPASLRWYQTPVARRGFTVLIAFVMALAIHLVEYYGWLAGAEGRAADAYLTTTFDSASEAPPVVTLAIDNQDYREYFNDSSPLDAAALMQLVVAVQSAEPTVVGVDILTESGEYDADSNYQRARALNTAILEAPARRVPVVWAGDARVPGNVREAIFLHWLFQHETFRLVRGVQPGRMRMSDPMGWLGVPIFPLERDRAVRRVPRTWTDDATGRSRLTFAGTIAWLYCTSTGACPSYQPQAHGHGEDIFISYARNPPAPTYRIREVFTCTALEKSPKGSLCLEWQWKDGKPPDDLAGSIVLIGGTYDASKDFFAAPTEKPIAGLLLNAQAVRAEIAGPTVTEWPRWVTLLLDTGVGLLIALIFSGHVHAWITRLLGPIPAAQKKWRRQADHVMWRVFATFLIGLVVAAISYWWLFPRWHILWLSWVGMLLVGLAFHIALIETRHVRMKAAH
jgi:CHASE2 domain-containing sensor protein